MSATIQFHGCKVTTKIPNSISVSPNNNFFYDDLFTWKKPQKGVHSSHFFAVYPKCLVNSAAFYTFAASKT